MWFLGIWTGWLRISNHKVSIKTCTFKRLCFFERCVPDWRIAGSVLQSSTSQDCSCLFSYVWWVTFQKSFLNPALFPHCLKGWIFMVWLHVSWLLNTFPLGSSLLVPFTSQKLCFTLQLSGSMKPEIFAVFCLQLLQETLIDRSILMQFSVSVSSALLSFLRAKVSLLL